jgi:hypothetical protein
MKCSACDSVNCDSFVTLHNKKIDINTWSESVAQTVCIGCYNNLSLCSKCNQQSFNETNKQCVVCDYVYCHRCNKKLESKKSCSDCDFIDKLFAIEFLISTIFLSIFGFKTLMMLSLIAFIHFSEKHIMYISELVAQKIIRICISVCEVVAKSLMQFGKNLLEMHNKIS